MSFRLGLVGLCTSHPGAWLPIIRDMAKEGLVDLEVVAAWDSGETRPEGFARSFCAEQGIPTAVETLEDMVDMVDGVIVHTTNWDRHLEQALPFVQAGRSVLLDKPIAGNLQELNQVLDWAKQGKTVTGGSSLRFSAPVAEFLAQPIEERGEIHTAYAATGVDDYNYGIHAYAIMFSLMGSGISSAQYLGFSGQRNVKLTWKDGRIGLLTIGKNAWLPFRIMAVTSKKTEFIDGSSGTSPYRSLLEAELPYLTGQTNQPPMPMAELIEPELAALAARMSWMDHGREVFIDDLRLDDPGYDGTQFALGYRRARMGG
jgi:Oxidoreductase family, NAD-binding Rossmann fold